jgi:hypothetical protein
MNLSSSCLLLSGVASFLIALLHLALAPGPRWYRHFGADELAQLHEQGSRFFFIFSTVSLAAGLLYLVGTFVQYLG